MQAFRICNIFFQSHAEGHMSDDFLTLHTIQLSLFQIETQLSILRYSLVIDVTLTLV